LTAKKSRGSKCLNAFTRVLFWVVVGCFRWLWVVLDGWGGGEIGGRGWL